MSLKGSVYKLVLNNYRDDIVHMYDQSLRRRTIRFGDRTITIIGCKVTLQLPKSIMYWNCAPKGRLEPDLVRDMLSELKVLVCERADTDKESPSWVPLAGPSQCFNGNHPRKDGVCLLDGGTCN